MTANGSGLALVEVQPLPLPTSLSPSVVQRRSQQAADGQAPPRPFSPAVASGGLWKLYGQIRAALAGSPTSSSLAGQVGPVTALFHASLGCANIDSSRNFSTLFSRG